MLFSRRQLRKKLEDIVEAVELPYTHAKHRIANTILQTDANKMIAEAHSIEIKQLKIQIKDFDLILKAILDEAGLESEYVKGGWKLVTKEVKE